MLGRLTTRVLVQIQPKVDYQTEFGMLKELFFTGVCCEHGTHSGSGIGPLMTTGATGVSVTRIPGTPVLTHRLPVPTTGPTNPGPQPVEHFPYAATGPHPVEQPVSQPVVQPETHPIDVVTC